MKFLILAAVVALAAGEAPPHVGLSNGYSNGGGNGGFGGGSSGSGLNEYVDEALLARVGALIASGGDGSGTPQGNEGQMLDAEIFTRVSGSLGDDSGSSSGPSSSYGPPSRSSSASLGQPEPAQRIAEFDLESSSSDQGGYDAAPAPAPAPEYGAPSRSAPPPPRFGGSSSSGGAITLGRPMAAQRVADFSIMGGSAPTRGGNNGGYN